MICDYCVGYGFVLAPETTAASASTYHKCSVCDGKGLR